MSRAERALRLPPIAVLLCAAFGAGSVAASGLSLDEDAVKVHCAEEWSGNFAMQEFCINQIKAGFSEFSGQVERESDAAMQSALQKCREEWGVQWNMSAFCGTQQIAGRDKIPTILADLPPEVHEETSSMCLSEWPNDFAMTAFCAEQNTYAWKRINN